ncbi:class I SAM-dependent methyltransferase [Streptomyces virginiae]|uniref:Class I SAM-dependent methyltransferase n=1 Tax=Streptomyces erythrochromogenes TaxID=285574 RepID=A0ABZ1Q605_9ACTN|nr:class I SAM-dependent methyltransferase [Streptomyces erythrochromogenes]MCX5582745.1 class I SAM-dependent methyltransferase [Streptomyces erythrochromogenes]
MYGAELAEIYELIHRSRGKDYLEEAAEVERQVRAHKPDAASLLDVACGTGAHLRRFDELFDEVAGLELSEPMARFAQAALPHVPVHVGDMRDFELGRTYDVITCMFGSIGYLLTQDALVGALRRFARHLAPDGVLAVDPWWFPETYLHGHVAGATATVGGRTVSRVSHSVREGDASRMNVHYLVADGASGVRHFHETHLIGLFSRERYEAAFGAAGFRVDYVPVAPAGRGLFVGVPSAG